ncbi:hypothetical protein COOONC_28342 [Cooperia oncophora]
MTEQFARILNQSSMLLLVTFLTPVYRGQNDISLFTELAREYWNCNEDLLSVEVPQRRLITPKYISQELANDKQACEEVTEGRNCSEMQKPPFPAQGNACEKTMDIPSS